MSEFAKKTITAVGFFVAFIVMLYISNKVEEKHYNWIVTVALLLYLAGVATIGIAVWRFFQ